MDKLIRTIFQLKDFRLRADDDFVDRLNRQYTPGLLAIFAVVVGIKQYVGDPISCWTPSQFSTAQVAYANTVCWVRNTYYVSFDAPLPEVTRKRRYISYYQWVPMILCAQALLYFLPFLMWRFLNRRIGLNLASVIEAARATQKAIFPETREKSIRYVVMQIDSYLTSYTKKYLPEEGAQSGVRCAKIRSCISSCVLSHQVNYLSICYLFTKLLYLTNGVVQLLLLDGFLGFERFNFKMYGIQVFTKFVKGDDWISSDRFPRVTICDFLIRQQTNVHRYTIQCVLPINLFNEKIFLFVWFWLLASILTTLVNVTHWCFCLAYPSGQTGYVRRQLVSVDTMIGQMSGQVSKGVEEFTGSFLCRDGLLIVRLVSCNAGGLVAADVLYGLWSNFGPEKRALSTLAGKRHQAKHGHGPLPPLHSSQLDSRMPMYADTSRWAKVKRLISGKSPSTDSGTDFDRAEEI